MGDIVRQVAVNAPTSKVFRYVADPHNAPGYISSITRIIAGPEGTLEKGSVWRAEANFFGQKRLLNLRLDELAVDRGVRFVLDGDPQALLVIRLAPDGSSTSVSLILDVPSVPSILLNALLGGLLTEDMARLKRNLETSP